MWWVPLQTRKSRCGEADRLAQSLKAIHVGAGLETRPRGTDTHAIDYFSVPLLEMSFTCHNNRALKVHNSVAVGALTKLHHHHHCLVPEHFFPPNGNLLSLKESLLIPVSPSPRQPVLCFFSLWIFLFWIFHINRLIQYVATCVWLLSLSIVFVRVIYVSACISTTLPFIAE